MQTSYVLCVSSVFWVLLLHLCGVNSYSQRSNDTMKLNGTSADCSCGVPGSLSSACLNDTTRQCICQVGYSGERCTDCSEGYHHSDTNQCLPCQCDGNGSLSNECNSFGWCRCKPGYGGKHCYACLDGYYGLPGDGGQDCHKCSCEQTIIKCLSNISRSIDPGLGSICQRCRMNTTHLSLCMDSTCPSHQYLLPDGTCTPCQCNQTSHRANVTRQCDLITGICVQCNGEKACALPGASNSPVAFQYQEYIVASGALAGAIVIVLVIVMGVFCQRHYRGYRRRTPLPHWTIELRHDDVDDDDAAHVFNDVDVLYLDDSYLMEPSDYGLTRSTESMIDERSGYRMLS